MDGEFVKSALIFIGFWRRVGASLLDCIILLPIILTYAHFYKYFYENNLIVPVIFYFVLFYGYHVFFNCKFGGTPGKLILKYRIVNENGNFLSAFKAFIRYSLYLPQTISFILMKFVFRSNNGNIIFESIDFLVSLLVMIDVLFVAFTKNKRALHDFIAKSYVVTKQSLSISKDI